MINLRCYFNVLQKGGVIIENGSKEIDLREGLGNFAEYSKALNAIIESTDPEPLYNRLKAAILVNKITINTAFLPSNAKTFSIVFLDKYLSETVIQDIIGEKITIVSPIIEHRGDLLKAIHTSIWLDVYLKDETDRIFTLDMHRDYLKTRNRNRNVYYGAKELAVQKVEQGKYEKLKANTKSSSRYQSPSLSRKTQPQIRRPSQKFNLQTFTQTKSTQTLSHCTK
jgi:hypothetical protein